MVRVVVRVMVCVVVRVVVRVVVSVVVRVQVMVMSSRGRADGDCRAEPSWERRRRLSTIAESSYHRAESK